MDWNRNGFIEPIPVAADINQDALDDPAAVCPTLQPLMGFDDWSYVNAHMAFQCNANFSDEISTHVFPSTPELHPQETGGAP